MGALYPPRLVTPLVAVLYGDESHYAAAKKRLEPIFGKIECESEAFPFTKTEYYIKEIGPAISRRFITYQGLHDPALLAGWKLTTNKLEEELAAEFSTPAAPRPVNLDPGYLTGAKLVLASTKDFAHRIYLRDGIFAEITLRFKSGGWLAHDCTFPDFRAPDYHGFLTKARNSHLRKDGQQQVD
jgi:hypothetical protein